jgi:tetratricopeptide (TPR) repeat protein
MKAGTLHTAAYDEYERGLLVLHQLSLAGQDGSPAADQLRDRLLAPWSHLTPEQREFGDGVSGDLYMLEPTEGEIHDPASDEERSPQQLGRAIKSSLDRRDWFAILQLLRKGPAFLPPYYVAHLRARAYQALGSPAVALAFARHAHRLDPDNVVHRLMELELLDAAGQPAEADAIAWNCLVVGRPAALVLAAASRLLLQTRDQAPDVGRTTTERLAVALQGVIRSDGLASDADAAELAAFAHLLLGVCFDQLGDATVSRREFEACIAIPARDLGGFASHARLREFLHNRFGDGPKPASADQRFALFDIVSDLKPPTAA